MTNKSKQKGTAFESAIVAYLKEWWPNVERRALSGNLDRGDIAGIDGVVIEAKNAQKMDLSGWSNETAAEVVNAAADLGILVVKRRMKPVSEAYAIMPLRSVVWLLRRLLDRGDDV